MRVRLGQDGSELDPPAYGRVSSPLLFSFASMASPLFGGGVSAGIRWVTLPIITIIGIVAVSSRVLSCALTCLLACSTAHAGALGLQACSALRKAHTSVIRPRYVCTRLDGNKQNLDNSVISSAIEYQELSTAVNKYRRY